MPERWTVLKFGGTSVAGAPHWETIAGLAQTELSAGRRTVLVCSALAGVTDMLQGLSDGAHEAGPAIRHILDLHARLADSLGIDATALLQEGDARIRAALDGLTPDGHPSELAALLGQGEWLSSRLGAQYLGESLPVDWVDAMQALRVLPESEPDSRRAWLSARCAATADPGLAERWSAKAPVLVTQGFVAAAADGRTALLGRGGSDTSAALLAARLEAREIVIWTDVPGLFSADPRDEPGARLIGELDYWEALEMAASGARVVHPRCIRAAAEAGIPVEIRDLSQPARAGSRIHGQCSLSGPGVKAVVRQDGMLVLLLENLDTRQQVGFLAWVFGVISGHGVSVDLVATSETTTTLAINLAANHLDGQAVAELTESLGARCRVESFTDCSCVNLVGRGARTALARLGPAVGMFDEQPLLMLSQSANDLSISLLVPADQAANLCRRLHAELITAGHANGRRG